jgi:hypothetical protein
MSLQSNPAGDPELDGRHAALTSALAEARNDLRSLKVSVTELESLLSNQATHVETLDDRTSSIDWKTYTQELESATEEIREWRERIEDERNRVVSSIKEEVVDKVEPLLKRLSPLEESVEEKLKQLRPWEDKYQSMDGRVQELQVVVQKLLDANTVLDTLAARDERIKAEGTSADASHDKRIDRLEQTCALLTSAVKDCQEDKSLTSLDQRLDDVEKVALNLSSAFKEASLLTWGQELSDCKQQMLDYGAEVRDCREELSRERQRRAQQLMQLAKLETELSKMQSIQDENVSQRCMESIENLNKSFQLSCSSWQAQHDQIRNDFGNLAVPFDAQHIPEPGGIQKCLDAFTNLESQLERTAGKWQAEFDNLLSEFMEVKSGQLQDESVRMVIMQDVTKRLQEAEHRDSGENLDDLRSDLGATLSRVSAVEIRYTELEATLKEELRCEANHRFELFKVLSERVSTLSNENS